jgi:beta-glucosidase
LLQNKNSLLPLSKNTRIALIGPFADSRQEMFSMWSFLGDANSVVTIAGGIKKQDANVTYAQGSQVSDDSLTNKKLRISFDKKRQRELVNSALEIAKNADVIVAVLGEPSVMAGESKSRTDIAIPACQRELLRSLKATGKPVVLLLSNGRPLTIQDDLPNTDAVVDIWHLGTEAGNAIADVLFGNYNPSGKLTMTFPRSVGQIPIYYNHKNTGRPYKEGETEDFVSNYKDQYNTPLFPFGFGLSYTTFTYDKIMLSDTLLKGPETLKATVKITNTGKYAGGETVQLYLGQPIASVSRPVKELKNFQKIYLEAGETKSVTFNITTEDLKFYNGQLKYDWEPGKFKIFVGTSSQDAQESAFTWNKSH